MNCSRSPASPYACVCFVVLAASWLTGAPAAAEDAPESLVLRYRAGRVLRVEEEIADTYKQIERKNREVIRRDEGRFRLNTQFAEETRALSPYVLERRYQRADWTTGQGRARASRPDQVKPSSVAHRTLTYGHESGLKLDEGKVDDREVETLFFFYRVVQVLLPREAVKVGASWALEEAGLIQAFCGPNQKLGGAAARGRGSLKSVKSKRGKRSARLSFEIQVRRVAGADNPALEMTLKGVGDFDVEAGVFLSLRFDGRYTTTQTSDRPSRGDPPRGKLAHAYTLTTTGRRVLTCVNEVVAPGRDTGSPARPEDESP